MRENARAEESDRVADVGVQVYQTPPHIAQWLNKEREGREQEPDPVFPGLVSSDEE